MPAETHRWWHSKPFAALAGLHQAFAANACFITALAEEQIKSNNETASPSGRSGQALDTSGGRDAPQAISKRFYGTIDLDPIQAKKQFADLVNEVVLLFTKRPGVRVRISVECEAASNSGFDSALQRAVKENCDVLRFKNGEFEDS